MAVKPRTNKMNKAKIYVVTVMDRTGNKLVDVRGKKGLKQLVESKGLQFGGFQMSYAESGVETQMKLEWSDTVEWAGDALVRDHVFLYAK